MSDEGKKRTVRAQRRRRTDSTGERERAEAPRRRRAGDEGAAEPAAGRTEPRAGTRPRIRRPAARPLPSGRPLPIGGRSLVLIIGALALMAACICVIVLLTGPGDSGEVALTFPTEAVDSSQPQVPNTPIPFEPTESLEPFVPPVVSGEGKTWLVMLYQDADDKILEQDIYVDLNEAERVGSSDRVHVVAQMDRYRAGYQGDGNWDSARRFYITWDDDLERVRSQVVEDLGEVNMSDGQTLVDFVTWAVDTFPADNYVLILSDHGMGWPGGWSDPAPGSRGDPSIPLSSALGDELFLMELDEALGEIRIRTNIDKFELIGLDACLMGHVEVYDALSPHADYAVASQETEPALGWAYTSFLEALQRNPDMSGEELGRMIVDSYIEGDQRIVDDQARAELLARGSPLGGLFGLMGGPTAEQLAQQMGRDSTLALVDLAAFPEVLDSLNDLAFALQGASQPAVAEARNYARSYTSVFGKNVPPSYIDLGNFAELLKRESRDTAVVQAADKVLASLDRAVVAEKHGPGQPGTMGMSVYFPNSQLYGSPITGPQSYTAVAERFARESLWDDFLAYHYTGRPFDPAERRVAVPEPDETVSAPGAGKIEVSPVTLSASVAAPAEPVLLSADISGDNVGYILFFTGFYDQDANSIFVADVDYLESADTREIDGVYYPDWGEGAFTLEFEWEPLMFAIGDGVDSVVALLTPRSYGALPEEAVYTVEGIYAYADGGESRHARLYFRDGYLRQVFGFTGEGGTGAPREIIPQSGDRFTVLEKWMDLDSQGRVSEVVMQPGGTLTFGDQMFAWEELYAAPGQYVLGFIVEDLDGNAYESFEQVLVR